MGMVPCPVGQGHTSADRGRLRAPGEDEDQLMRMGRNFPSCETPAAFIDLKFEEEDEKINLIPQVARDMATESHRPSDRIGDQPSGRASWDEPDLVQRPRAGTS